DNPLRLINAYALALGPAGLYFAGDQPKAFAAFMARLQTATKPYNIPPASLAQSNEPNVALLINDNLLTRDVTLLLSKITVPTLVINGKQDGVVTPTMAQSARDAIPGSVLTLL